MPSAPEVAVFEFRDLIADFTRTPPHVVKADLALVERRLPLSEFAKHFGGYVMWDSPETPTAEMPGPAIGVWGRRNASRFRRLLRERGLKVRRVEGEGPSQRIAQVSKQHPDGRLENWL